MSMNLIFHCPFFIQSFKCAVFPNAFHSDRVELLCDITNEPEVIRLSKTGQHTPQTWFLGDTNCSKKTILSFPILHNKTVNRRPPVVLGNLYKTNSKIGPDIKSFYKPIHTPKVTVRNPFAKDTEGGGHTQHVSRSIFSLQQSSAKIPTKLSNSGIHDKSDAHTLTSYNPKQLFLSTTKQKVSFLHMKYQYVAKNIVLFF